MDFSFDNIEICGMSCAVPKKIIDNTENADESILRLIKAVGIKQRRSLVGTGLRLVDLAIASAKDAIEKANVDMERIRVILYITGDPEFSNPSTAFYIQKELGISSNCIAYDINLECSGFIAGLQTGAALLNSTVEDKCYALLIHGADLTYQLRTVENDKLLFGDAASTTILKKDNSSNYNIVGNFLSDGTRYESIFRKARNAPTIMEGDTVFNFAIMDVPKEMLAFMEKNKISNENIDFFSLHQAQKFIVDRLAYKAKIDKNKILYSLQDFGNTSGTTIPLTLCNNIEKLYDVNRILAVGYGSGLSFGFAYLTILKKVVNEIIEM